MLRWTWPWSGPSPCGAWRVQGPGRRVVHPTFGRARPSAAPLRRVLPRCWPTGGRRLRGALAALSPRRRRCHLRPQISWTWTLRSPGRHGRGRRLAPRPEEAEEVARLLALPAGVLARPGGGRAGRTPARACGRGWPWTELAGPPAAHDLAKGPARPGGARILASWDWATWPRGGRPRDLGRPPASLARRRCLPGRQAVQGTAVSSRPASPPSSPPMATTRRPGGHLARRSGRAARRPGGRCGGAWPSSWRGGVVAGVSVYLLAPGWRGEGLLLGQRDSPREEDAPSRSAAGAQRAGARGIATSPGALPGERGIVAAG